MFLEQLYIPLGRSLEVGGVGAAGGEGGGIGLKLKYRASLLSL